MSSKYLDNFGIIEEKHKINDLRSKIPIFFVKLNTYQYENWTRKCFLFIKLIKFFNNRNITIINDLKIVS